MKKSTRLVVAALLSISVTTTTAFLAPTRYGSTLVSWDQDKTATTTALRFSHHHDDDNDDTEGPFASPARRQVFSSAMGAALGAVLTVLSSPPPAHATYSAYTHREADWQERRTKDEIKFSTAKSLRGQLAEIVPQNNERSRIFCPNGPSAAVSPLMENRCGDQLATPSVFGRTEDVLGNSIPGFADGYSFSKASGAAIGDMPEYGFTTNGRKTK